MKISSHSAVVDEIFIDDRILTAARLGDVAHLEQVTVKLNIRHSFRGDLQISLTSPAGTTIPLISRRPLDSSSDGFWGWTVMTPGFWGESVKGTWTLKVVNAAKAQSHGELVDYRLSFWGAQDSRVSETDQGYAAMFLADYYPPTPDYFDDKLGLWDVTRRSAVRGLIRRAGLDCSTLPS